MANELKLGVFVNVTGGLEPEVFMKAWRGAARFPRANSPDQVRLFLIGGESPTSTFLKEIETYQERVLSFKIEDKYAQIMSLLKAQPFTSPKLHNRIARNR